MKKIFFLILSVPFLIYAQNSNDKFLDALNYYNNQNYGIAGKMFKEIVSENNNGAKNLDAAKYYGADCLYQLDQLDGAAIDFENLISSEGFSNFRETAFYKLGIIYYKKEEYRKSRERLFSLMNLYPGSLFIGSAYYWLGKDYYAENKFIDAEENFNTAVEKKETNEFIVNTLYSLGLTHEKMNDFKNAVKNYDELLAYYKDDPLAPKSQLRIGVCYFSLKDYDNAVLELTDPLINKLSGKELTDSRLFLADSYSRLKEYKNALRVYTELQKESKDSLLTDKINFSLAWINFQQGSYGESYKLFSEIARNGSDTLSIQSLFWSGEAKRYMGDVNGAGDIYREFLKKYPDHPLSAKAQLGIGSVNFENTNPAEAEKALLNATISADKQTRGKAFTLLGELRLNKKLFEDSKKYFSEALKLTSKSSDLNNRASLGLAVSEFYLNHPDAAVPILENLKANTRNFETDKINFYLAESYFLQGQYTAALKNYNSVKSSSDEIIRQTVLGKAYSYFNLKDFPNAVYYFNEYASKYKNDPGINEVRLRLADSYFGNKNFEKASSIYKDLFSKENFTLDNDLAYYQYGQSLFKSGKSEEAIKALKLLQEKFPNSKYADESQYVIGWIYFQKNDFEKAISSYSALLHRSSKSSLKPIVYYSIGDSYFNLAQYDSSIIFYSKVLDGFPNTQYIFDAVNGIQYAYVAKNEPANAISFIDRFISANPKSKYNDQLFFKKGDLYYSTEKYDDAVKVYKEFIADFPESPLVPNAYYWVGKCYLFLKNETEAVNNFEAARARAQKSDIGISSAVETANIYTGKKQYSSAAKLLKETSDAVPAGSRVPELLYLEGINLIKDSKSSDAASLFEQIINYYEGNIFAAKAKVELGKLLLAQNNLSAAAPLLKDVGEKRSDDIGAEAQYYYGVILFNQNNIEDAISALVRVRSVYFSYDEWYTRSLLKLGDCYVKLNDKKQAREMYRAVLAKHPAGDYAAEAKRKLNQL